MNDSSATAVLDFEAPAQDADNHSSLNARRSFSARLTFLVPLLCCVGLLAALAWPIFQGRVYIADDLGAFHLPLRAFYAKQLAAAEPFDWNPELFCGFYLTGEGQAGTYHPLHWLLYRCFTLPVAFDLECWLTYPFMLVGMYLLLRSWRLTHSAGWFGSMAFTFGGFNLLHFVHPNVVAIVAHLPWLLLAIDALFRSTNPRGKQLAFIAIAVMTGSQLLLGSPQFVLFSLLMEVGYVLFLFSQPFSWRAITGGLSRWAAAVLLGMLIGGVQLLPTFDALASSVRHTAGAELAGQGSLHPLNLTQLVAPYLFSTRVVGQNTHELGLYIGAVPLVLAVWWFFGGGLRSSCQRLTWFAGITAAMALVWALGTFGPLGWFQAYVPIINRFRFPCRAIFLFQWATAALAALGFATLARQTGTAQNPSRKLWCLPAISIALAVIAPIIWPEFVSAWPLILAGPVLITVAVWLLLQAIRGSHWARMALIVFTAIDLGIYGFSYSIVGRTDSLANYVSTTSTPLAKPTGRVAVDLMSGSEIANGQKGLHVGDRIVLLGWNCVDGYLGLEPARRLDYLQPAALRAARVMWLSTQAAEKIRTAPSAQNTIEPPINGWSPLRNPLPRAWLVAKTILSANPAADISRVSLSDEALIDQPLPSPIEASGTPGKTNVLTDHPGHLVVETTSAAPQLLVISENFHPGWRATIDGKNTQILRINGDFIGLIAPAGGHQIDLQFRPRSLFYGRLVSGFGLSLIGAIFLWSFRPRN